MPTSNDINCLGERRRWGSGLYPRSYHAAGSGPSPSDESLRQVSAEPATWSSANGYVRPVELRRIVVLTLLCRTSMQGDDRDHRCRPQRCATSRSVDGVKIMSRCIDIRVPSMWICSSGWLHSHHLDPDYTACSTIWAGRCVPHSTASHSASMTDKPTLWSQLH